MSYAIILSKDNKVLVIDTTHQINKYINFLEREKYLNLIGVIDTHIHAGHVSGGPMLSKATSAPYLLPCNTESTYDFNCLDDYLRNFDEKIYTIKTSGHTKESICILVNDKYLFTVDTLFIESVGKSDLGQYLYYHFKMLYDSIINKIFSLNDNIIVLPSHTKVNSSINYNFHCESLINIIEYYRIEKFPTTEVFVILCAKSSQNKPLNFKFIRSINCGDINDVADYDEIELGGNLCTKGS